MAVCALNGRTTTGPSGRLVADLRVLGIFNRDEATKAVFINWEAAYMPVTHIVHDFLTKEDVLYLRKNVRPRATFLELRKMCFAAKQTTDESWNFTATNKNSAMGVIFKPSR